MTHSVRIATATDQNAIFHLYKAVAKNIGGIAREEDEITENYIANNLKKSLEKGICLVIENPTNKLELIAEMHCYQLEPKVFAHVFSELTIVVHPDFQGFGLGKQLFTHLLSHIETYRKDILRVELIARESNQKAIQFYEKIGFKQEGRFEKRINNKTATFEADIPMAWFNKNFMQKF
jgi:ribosomal protein S18 acetylase RimI-like enzyme